jgi:hypothetical protein
MNYQFDFVCTYQLMDTPEDQEQLYRIQLLQAFELETWNEFEINDTIVELFSILYLNDDFKAIIKKARNNDNIVKMFETLNMEYTGDTIFTVLFNYEYFDLLHSCIGDILINKEIHPTHLTNIMNAL